MWIGGSSYGDRWVSHGDRRVVMGTGGAVMGKGNKEGDGYERSGGEEE